MTHAVTHEVEVPVDATWVARPNVVTVPDPAGLVSALAAAQEAHDKLRAELAQAGYTNTQHVTELRNTPQRCWLIVRVVGQKPTGGLF